MFLYGESNTTLKGDSKYVDSKKLEKGNRGHENNIKGKKGRNNQKFNEQNSVSVARMGTKRVKGDRGDGKRYQKQTVLLPTWREHINAHWQILLGLMGLMIGLTKRQVYMQILLGLRGILGFTKKQSNEEVNQGAGTSKPQDKMVLDEGKRALLNKSQSRPNPNAITIELAGQWKASRVIIDPGSTNTLMD